MLTRKFLKGMGLSDEQVDSIIDQHTETVDGLKEQIKEYKADAEKVPGLEKKLAEAQADLDTEKKSSWKVKYDALKEDFDAYKSEQTAKETHKAKESAYRALLTEAGISEKRIAAVLRVSDVDSVELDDDGKVKGADKLKDGIKEEWGDFIQTASESGAKTPNPPANNGGGTMTKEEIFKIKDPAKRQAAIGDNLELFKKEA